MFGIFGRIDLTKKCPSSPCFFLYKASAGYCVGTYGKIQGVAAKKDILDVYRDFRKKEPSVCYAFGDAEFFMFYMTDGTAFTMRCPTCGSRMNGATFCASTSLRSSRRRLGSRLAVFASQWLQGRRRSAADTHTASTATRMMWTKVDEEAD